MSLSRHLHKDGTSKSQVSSAFATRYQEANQPTPKYVLPDKSMSAPGAYQMVKDLLVLDGNPVLNLASFVTTWCEPEADQLYLECSSKNIADQLQYPKSNEIQDRCVNILANLYHAPLPRADHSRTDSSSSAVSCPPFSTDKDRNECENVEGGCVGSSTIGSSEAIQLAGLAMKWRWRERMAQKRGCKAGEVSDKLNMILSSASHVSLFKFCLYFDVEPRVVNIAPGRYTMGMQEMLQLCDENTIGVMAILGNTLTGEFDDIKQISEALDELQKVKGWDIPIHVDAASGGFVAPFLAPELVWDFRVPRVRSINVSGHKFGLTYPGLGWILFRTKADLPANLVFHINYLGNDEPTFCLNFSKPASQVILQYYNFLRLGFEGFSRIIQQCNKNAATLAERLSDSGLFEVISKHDQPALPVVVFRLAMDTKSLGFDEKRLTKELQRHGWILPAYNLSKDAEEICVIRCVCRESFTLDLGEQLLDAIGQELETLMSEYCHDERLLKEQIKQPGDLKKRLTGKAQTLPPQRGSAPHKHTDHHKAHQKGLVHTIC